MCQEATFRLNVIYCNRRLCARNTFIMRKEQRLSIMDFGTAMRADMPHGLKGMVAYIAAKGCFSGSQDRQRYNGSDYDRSNQTTADNRKPRHYGERPHRIPNPSHQQTAESENNQHTCNHPLSLSHGWHSPFRKVK